MCTFAFATFTFFQRRKESKRQKPLENKVYAYATYILFIIFGVKGAKKTW